MLSRGTLCCLTLKNFFTFGQTYTLLKNKQSFTFKSLYEWSVTWNKREKLYFSSIASEFCIVLCNKLPRAEEKAVTLPFHYLHTVFQTQITPKTFQTQSFKQEQ